MDLIVADGLPGFSQVARKHFPDSDIQRCVVHLQRGLLRKVRPKDKEAFSRDMQEASNNFDKNSSQELAREKLGLFASKWEGSYGRVVNQRRGVYSGLFDVYLLCGRSEASNIPNQFVGEAESSNKASDQK